jgi:predicted phosphodiesterase
MEHLVFSDVHSNLRALEAVLANAEYDTTICLGDIIEYGDPSNDCIAAVKNACDIVLKGNHEQWELTDKFSLLNPEERQYLETLPLEERIDEALLVHANPADPRKHSRFINSRHRALQAFDAFEESVCFVGHSHSPKVFKLSAEGELIVERPGAFIERTIDLLQGWRYIVDVGSVGQPDSSYPACYAIYDASNHAVFLRRLANPCKRQSAYS